MCSIFWRYGISQTERPPQSGMPTYYSAKIFYKLHEQKIVIQHVEPPLPSAPPQPHHHLTPYRRTKLYFDFMRSLESFGLNKYLTYLRVVRESTTSGSAVTSSVTTLTSLLPWQLAQPCTVSVSLIALLIPDYP